MISTLKPYKGIRILEAPLLEHNQEITAYGYLLRVDQRRTKDNGLFLSLAFKDGYGQPVYGQMWSIDPGSPTFAAVQAMVQTPVRIHAVCKQFTDTSSRCSLDVLQVDPVDWEDIKPLVSDYFSSTYTKAAKARSIVLKMIELIADQDLKEFVTSYYVGSHPDEIIDNSILQGSIGGVQALLAMEMGTIRSYFQVQPDFFNPSDLGRLIGCAIVVELMLAKNRPFDKSDDDAWVMTVTTEISSKIAKYPDSTLVGKMLRDAQMAIMSMFGLQLVRTAMCEIFLMVHKMSTESIELGSKLSCYPEGSVVAISSNKSIRR